MRDNFYFRYCGLYLVPYIGLSLAVIAITIFTSWQPPSVLSIIIAMVSGYYPAYQFVKDHNRAPTKSEKHRFTLATLILIFALSTVAVGIFMAIVPGLSEQIKMMMDQLSGGVFAGIIIVTMLIYYGVILLGFGMGAKMQIKALEKQRAKGTP